MGSAVGRVVVTDGSGRIQGMGTGFLITPGYILTCHHVIPSSEVARRSRIDFDFFETDGGYLKPLTTCTFLSETWFITNQELDITILKVEERALSDRMAISLETANGRVLVGEHVNVIHHGNGEPQRFSIRESKLLSIEENFLYYSRDATPGSAGAPVFNDQWELVGVHHAAVPSRDKKGRVLSVDGTVWSGDAQEPIAWLAGEAARVASIRRWLEQTGMATVDSVDTNVAVIPTESEPVGGTSKAFIPDRRLRDSVFISYAHADQEHEKWKDRLVLQLRAIPEIGDALIWDDSRIEAGSDWLHEIEYALQRARVAILLVGPNFLTSKFVLKKELPPLIEAAQSDGLKMFPLITDFAPYSRSVLSKYQSFNSPKEPLESLSRSEQNRLLTSLATKVADVFSNRST
jgi:V8-like Glu-specific endopeptidase